MVYDIYHFLVRSIEDRRKIGTQITVLIQYIERIGEGWLLGACMVAQLVGYGDCTKLDAILVQFSPMLGLPGHSGADFSSVLY